MNIFPILNQDFKFSEVSIFDGKTNFCLQYIDMQVKMEKTKNDHATYFSNIWLTCSEETETK